jgi:hypothetical protein
MDTLTVYKNADQGHSLPFRATTPERVLDKLKQWLDKHNGENGKPASADGLTIFTFLHPQDGPQGLTLTRVECYGEWEIDDAEHPADPECFDTWAEARDQFVAYAKDYGEWNW